MSKSIFVTGMLRSGTTLLQQVLSTLPDTGFGFQELTALFLDEKKRFLDLKQIDSTLPLSNYFPVETTPEDFTNYLDSVSFSKKYTANLKKGLRGDKEVLCEEFLPHLAKSLKTVIILRDPRDVIASIHFGKGEKYSGLHRPLLFDLRNWRKSFAFAAFLSGSPGFMFIKYEDLANSFESVFSRLKHFLELKPSISPGQVIQNLSINWQGNSSFENSASGIYKNSVGISKKVLPLEISDFIESVCFPEMEALGYSIRPENRFNYKGIKTFKDPFPLKRKEFSRFNYETELNMEVNRLSLLESNSSGNNIRKSFIFDDVFNILKTQKKIF